MHKTKLNRALWLLMEFDIYRYLASNTFGRLSGGEKAERHLRLVENYLKVMSPNYPESLKMFIHDHTQTLTSYMDEVIGFPVEDPNPDYDELSVSFFEKFLDLCDEGMEAAKEQSEQSSFDGTYSHIQYLNQRDFRRE